MSNLPKKYDPKQREAHWQGYWETQDVYRWEQALPREQTYVIDTPPPTVSGMLHMGHIYSYVQADFIARFQRMRGKTVFYPMGFDDNGLPTERLVEKTIKKRAVDLGREKFIKECIRIGKESRAEFRSLFESIALSVDWEQEYHTVSEQSRRISQLSFLDLFEKEKVYRKLQPMLWDPVDQTAIAQAEVEDKEMEGTFSDIIFFVEEDHNADGSRAEFIIGTTRPELIPACVAVFYHPDDTRYQHLKGKHAITPLFGVKVPIFEDESVEPEKGSGIMMCCTFGDEADIEKWRKHDLPVRLVLNKYGKLCNLECIGTQHPETGQDWTSVQIPERLAEYAEKLNNLKVINARKAILEMLAEYDVLIENKPIIHAVKCAERSGAPLEILPTPQWFIQVLDQKEELKTKAAECNWHPEFMKVRMDQWIDGLNWDWCISRQRYFGVPFPVWYSKREGEEGKVIVAKPEQLPVNPLVDLPENYSADEVEREADVMDTWATSSVSPQLSSHGINRYFTPSPTLPLKGEGVEGNPYILDSERHQKLYPADLRPQAHEIIRTWAFGTLVKSHYHEDTIPWTDLMISGWCLASDKTKMSKSKGNVVTPVKLIEQHGADAVRYWTSTSRLGSDTAFSEDVLKIGKKLVTKLWNASKFVALQLDALPERPSENADALVKNGTISEALDQWILSRLRKTITKATEELEAYEFCLARMAIEDFFWNDFCDNYLELVKSRTYGNAGIKEQQSALNTLYHCLQGILRLFAPFTPHVTEELYQGLLTKDGESIHARGMWPDTAGYPLNEDAETIGIAVMEILEAVRKLKSERNVSIKTEIETLTVFAADDAPAETALAPAMADLLSAANVQSIGWKNAQAAENERYTIEAVFAAATDVA